MATSIFTSQTPAILDGDDGTDYTLGTVFERSTDGSITHGRWYFPNPVPTGTTEFVLYDEAAETELARAAFVTPTPAAWNTVELSSPVAYTASTVLVAAVHTSGMYVATADFFADDLVNGDITAPAAENGRLGNTDEYPSIVSGNSACFFADVVFASDEVEPAEGAAEMTLALAVAAEGRRDSAGAAAVGLQMTAAVTGARSSAGAAAAGLQLTVAAAGARDSAGAAAAGLALSVAAAGSRPSLGTVALGLVLSPAAFGPNGGPAASGPVIVQASAGPRASIQTSTTTTRLEVSAR